MSAENEGKKLEEHVKAGGWRESQTESVWKEFPVRGVQESLRVNFAAGAYADLICHAKEDLSSEVCGVLVGEVCEDSEGAHVSVSAIVRGTSARAGASHVTYTQETWNEIHEMMEREHPGLHIIGWYHSHPGFGVEFSDMDLFIQENFFAGRGQIAFVTDPLGGEEAICVKSCQEMEHLERFWVDGRERRCVVLAARCDESREGGDRVAYSIKAMQAIEDRLTQALLAIEELRSSYYRFLTVIGVIVATGVLFWMGNTVYDRIWGQVRPPETQAFLPGPVKIKNEWHWIGASLVTQRLSPEFERKLQEAELAGFAAAMSGQLSTSGTEVEGAQSQSVSEAGEERTEP